LYLVTTAEGREKYTISLIVNTAKMILKFAHTSKIENIVQTIVVMNTERAEQERIILSTTELMFLVKYAAQ